MQQFENPELTDMDIAIGAEEPEEAKDSSPEVYLVSGFDWLALSIVIIIAAIFALAARLQSQPATSLVPAAILSATGCGLLVNGLRKARTRKGVGILEAALGGLSIAVFQFIAALTFPSVIPSLSNPLLAGPGFFSTWALIGGFSILFSMVGATLGHLAFAPLRPLPANKRPASSNENDEVGAVSPRRPFLSILISILLFGLAPILVGYVFAAAFNFSLQLNGYNPSYFSSLRVVSALLPWQIPTPLPLTGAAAIPNLMATLWRIPVFFGNSSYFDPQALEPYIFNAAGLAFLLLTCDGYGRVAQKSRLWWGNLLLLEAILGLILVLPATLWIAPGLQGIFQFHGTDVLLGTLHLLNPLSIALNLISGPLLCGLTFAIIARIQRA